VQDRSIVLEQTDSIARLTLSAPPKNEMGAAFFKEMSDLKPELLRLSVHGMIVSGKGRHFSSGANLDQLTSMLSLTTTPAGIRSLMDNSDGFSLLAGLPFPVVAMIQGCCLGSGLECALACHFRVAAKNAVIGLPEIGFGLMPGCGGTVRLTRLIGYQKAMRLILTGGSLLAPDALKERILDAVVEKERLEWTAMQIIERFRNCFGQKGISFACPHRI
jgi:enoyl-CoA hydratase/carnithine racemase